MQDEGPIAVLLSVMDSLAYVARMMDPRRLHELSVWLGTRDASLRALADENSPLHAAATFAMQACAGVRAAPDAENPILEAYRSMRQYSRSLEALTALAETETAVGRYLLEPRFRDDPTVAGRLAARAHPASGAFHFSNETSQRGGFSVYVPPWYDPAQPMPLIFALHGGSGHGRLFLWNWVPEARSRGMIVVAPTAVGSTWSLMEPEIDSGNLGSMLDQVRGRWRIDPSHMLLSGMSDGGTFTLSSGLAEDSPFTHLAPVAASFHPMILGFTDPRRLGGLPIHLTHGVLDWMFPVDRARMAYRTLKAAGADVTYREIADLSHAYPRDGQGEVMDWFMAS